MYAHKFSTVKEGLIIALLSVGTWFFVSLRMTLHLSTILGTLFGALFGA